jgi:hypothetical protein
MRSVIARRIIIYNGELKVSAGNKNMKIQHKEKRPNALASGRLDLRA